MKILATVNLGGTYIPQNVMESHIAAASRWGAQYLQLTSLWGETDQMWVAKTRLHRAGFPAEAQVCYIDGDAVIRADCPDVFDLVGGNFGAVLNPPSYVAEHEWYSMLGKAGITTKFNPEMYFNGGLLVFTPGMHAPIWEIASTLSCLARAYGPLVEQTYLNFGIQAVAPDLTVLPREYNAIGPDVWQGDVMNAYIYHFAPTSLVERPDKRARMESIDWRTVPEGVLA